MFFFNNKILFYILCKAAAAADDDDDDDEKNKSKVPLLPPTSPSVCASDTNVVMSLAPHRPTDQM